MLYMVLPRKVDDLYAAAPAILHGIKCPARLALQKTDAPAAVVHQMTIAALHTAWRVVRCSVDDFVCLLHYRPIRPLRLRRPSVCLVMTGQHKDQLDPWIRLTQSKHALRGKCIKALRAAGSKKNVRHAA